MKRLKFIFVASQRLCHSQTLFRNKVKHLHKQNRRTKIRRFLLLFYFISHTNAVQRRFQFNFLKILLPFGLFLLELFFGLLSGLPPPSGFSASQ